MQRVPAMKQRGTGGYPKVNVTWRLQGSFTTTDESGALVTIYMFVDPDGNTHYIACKANKCVVVPMPQD